MTKTHHFPEMDREASLRTVTVNKNLSSKATWGGGQERNREVANALNELMTDEGRHALNTPRDFISLDYAY